MADFEAGKLVWRLVTVGKQVLQRDQADAQDAFEKTGKAAAGASKDIEGAGDATERTSKKSRESKAPLDEQAKSQRKAGEEAREAAKKQREAAAAAEKQREAAKDLSKALLVAGAATGAFVALSVAKYTEFGAQMSNTAAATKATAAEQRELADAALDAGADTAYSATEAAAAQEELAKAGQSVDDIVGGSLTGSLALAAAGQLEVARSAEIMATVLTQFKLPATEAGHVADVLAAGAGKAQGSVDDLSLALSYVGPLANSMGWSLEETAGVIAYFSTQGVQGEKAGTALRGVLAALQAPSAAAAKVMGEYGINVYDANGRMLEAAPLAQELKNKLSGLTDQERQSALGRIFGNESLLAATLLYEGGAKAVDKWTDELNDEAYATEQAAQRQDNLAGDIEKLGGAFDTALIRSGSGANEVLRTLVQITTELVDIFGDAPAPVQATALVLGTATTAALLLAGATLAVKARWSEWQQTLNLTNGQMARSAIIAGGVGFALTGVITVVALLMQAQAEARQKAESYLSTLETGTNKVTAATKEMASTALAAERSFLWMKYDSAYDAAEKLGISLDLVRDAAVGDVDALKQLQTELDAARKLSLAHAGSAGEVEKAVARESGSIEEAVRVAEQKQSADAGSIESSKSAAGAYLEAAEGAASLEDELSKLIDTLNEANGTGQDAISANISYGDALAKVDETIQKARDGAEGYALSLDQSTQIGRDNLGMLNDLAERAQKAAEAQFALDGNTDQYRATLEAGRQALIDRATALGMNADEAGALADQIYRIPPDTHWQMIAETAEAATRVDRIRAAIDALPPSKRINVVLNMPNGQEVSDRQLMDQFGFGSANGNFVEAYASGGVRESHVAQMARAGAVRVWAEPETEGETYLPHAQSKRGAAEVYLAQTASLFGGQYIPASAMGSGSASQAGAGTATPNVTFGDIIVPPGAVTPTEVRAIFREEIEKLLGRGGLG